jgi:UDP-glucuronate 4-epimerase
VIRRILLTGGAGFIGSHVAGRLAESGHAVTILDSLDPYYSVEEKRRNVEIVRELGAVEFVHADIRDVEAVDRAFRASRPDVVIHLAARAGVRASVREPGVYVDVNVGGTQTLLDRAVAHGVRRFVFASSSSVYGTSSPRPFREDALVLSPASPYAATKIAGEALVQAYANAFGIGAVALRLFTVYGPRQRPDLAIRRFSERILQGEPIPFYGAGDTSRDYTWVDDVVNAFVAAMDYDPPGGFDVMNIGGSQPVTLDRMVSILEAALGRPAVRVQEPVPVGDVEHTSADVSKAARILGYSPRVGIEEGLARFAEWIKETSA